MEVTRKSKILFLNLECDSPLLLCVTFIFHVV